VTLETLIYDGAHAKALRMQIKHTIAGNSVVARSTGKSGLQDRNGAQLHRLRAHLIEDIIELDGHYAGVGRHLVRGREGDLRSARTDILTWPSE